MAKDKRVSLVIETYGNYEVVVIITKDINKTRKKISDELGFTCEIEQDVDGLHSYNHNEMKSFILITPESSLGVISHEAFHCVTRIMSVIGAKLNKGSEESYAYLLTYLVDTIESIKESVIKK